MLVKKTAYGIGAMAAGITLLAACAGGDGQSNNTTLAADDPLRAYCQFPTDVPPIGADQATFDDFSWRMFAALSWAASPETRGAPDCDQPITNTGWKVWQSWKTLEQVFLPGAENPGPWQSGWSAENENRIGSVGKLSTNLADQEISAHLQPVGGWLIDQNRNPTYYQISSNEVSYDYIVSNNLYNAQTVQTFHPVSFPDQSAEIKASWRMLIKGKDDFSRFLVTEAQVAQFDDKGNPTGEFKAATLGLVGLHVILKTEDFPQWIWATFEQVDNVSPDAPTPSYYDPKAKNPNQSPCRDHAFPCEPKPGASFSTPDPLTRVTAITAETDAVNKRFQNMAGADFLKYYELITTQRPSNPGDPGDPLGTPEPNISANTTMESYIQPVSSCMACHQTANGLNSPYKSDFSFLLLHAQEPKSTAN